MDVKEAEAFFKHYEGHAFHMGREEYDRYREFENLDISKDTKEQWRQELLEEKLKAMSPLTEDTWCAHSRYIEILNDTETRRESNIAKLLDVMESFAELDFKSKVLIIENVVGRGAVDGLMRVIRDYNLLLRLDKIMREIIRSCETESEEDKQREYFDSAVSKYEHGMRFFKRKTFFKRKIKLKKC